MLLPQLLLQFLLENSSEHELVQPLIEILLDKIVVCRNLTPLLQSLRSLMFEGVENNSATRCLKSVLKWIGKQVEKDQNIPQQNQWTFMWQNIPDEDQNSSLYYMVSLLLELGLMRNDGREILYSKFFVETSAKDFLLNCASSQTLKHFKDKI